MPFSLSLQKTPSMIFSKALAQLKYVQFIQKDIENIETSKKELKLKFLNQTYIVHLVALWQAFIENLLKEASMSMRNQETNPQIIALIIHSYEIAIKCFNTPSKKNIDKLFLDGVGMATVTESWAALEGGLPKAYETLAYLLNARHSIAHTATSKESLNHDDNFVRMKILFDMAEILERRVLCSIKSSSTINA